MPHPSSATRPSRTKVWLPLRVNEPMGRPLSEWAYRTQRFPAGIKGSELVEATPEVQRETMVAWFLANHIPATGKHFGFAEARPPRTIGAYNTAPLNTTPLNGGIQVVGWGQGPWFNGGKAVDLLKAEFDDVVQQTALVEVADHFDGLWEFIPDNAPDLDPAKQTSEEQIAAIIAALDGVAEAVRKLLPEHGGIGHNGPPEDVPAITEDEKEIVLRATAETRSAVLSRDYSSASLAWDAVSPIIKKIGAAIANHVGIACVAFSTAIGIGAAKMLLPYLGYELGFWSKAEAVSAMLEAVKKLSH